MLKFKLPELKKWNTKTGEEWVVVYEIQHPETLVYERFKERKGLNKKGLTNKERREIAANHIADITRLLKEGKINPWVLQVEPVKQNVITVAEAFEQALAIRKPDLKHKTYLDCRNSQLHFMTACRLLGYDTLDIRQFNKAKVLQVLDLIRESRGISAHRWNIHKQRISPLFSVMVAREMIEANPILGVPRKKVAKGKTFEPPTDEEQLIIDKHLYHFHRPLFVYKSLIYATGARPDELLQVKLDQVDLKKGLITIFPEGTKVGMEGKVLPLGNDLVTLLTGTRQAKFGGDWLLIRKQA
jgi:integrase